MCASSCARADRIGEATIMANPILKRAPDTSVAKALKEALRAPKYYGRIPYHQVVEIIRAASDGDIVTDVEFRDIKKILRTQPLWGPAYRMLNAYLELYYPLKGPFLYPGDVEDLENTPARGNHACAALVQYTIPIGRAKTWREGIRVRGNDHLIKKGTAVATFEDGFYPNRPKNNHVAYYLSQTKQQILVMDQWEGKPRVSARPMPFLGQHADGSYKNPSNNGDALSVIMKKKP